MRSLIPAVFAVALALFAGTSFAYINVVWDPGYYGDFGLALDANNPDIVAQVLPGSPAAKADIQIGDGISRPRTLHERLLLTDVKSPRPGEKLTVAVTRAEMNRIITLQARKLPPLRVRDRVLLALKVAWLFAFLAMGLLLVLLRPNRMTWAFYLFALNLVLIIGPAQLPRGPDGWIVAGSIFAHDIIAPAGVAGFLVFCVRFPANAPSGWRRTLDRLAPYTAVIIAAHLLYQDAGYALVPGWNAIGTGEFTIFACLFAAYSITAAALLKQHVRARGRERRDIEWVCAFLFLAMLATIHDVLLTDFSGPWSILFLFVLGTLVFVITFVAARGLERHRIKWVVFGFACALAASIVDFMWFGLAEPPWFVAMLELLYVALPLTVAYAIIRYRVIDTRFAVGRALTFTIIASIATLIFACIDWLFSTRLPASQFEGAVYAGLALLIGFSLNAGRERIGKMIDLVLFRQWYHAQEKANAITDTINHAASKLELYAPLTADVAGTFSIASTALFERIEDGGFVRVGSCGWPPRVTWHIFPDEPLALRADTSSRVTDIDALLWQESDIPAGVARPSTLFPIVSAKRVVAILLCGAHENGTALAPDEIRVIRRFCTDAGLVYAGSAISHAGLSPAIDQTQAVGV